MTVFTFKSVDSPSFNTGNLLDDVVFAKAYKLTYDKNSADASGEVRRTSAARRTPPSPGQTKTNGTVKTITNTRASTPKQLDYGNVLDPIVFDKAYRLDYDKNAADAAGSVPSDTTPGTTRTASSKTDGKVCPTSCSAPPPTRTAA